MKKVVSILLGVISAILIIGLGIYVYFYFFTFSKIQIVDIPEDPISLHIDEELQAKVEEKEVETKKEIINIALFGVDQMGNEPARSDAILFITIDTVHNKCKVTSLMRDSYVDIEGYGWDKLNHAFAYGKGELALKTINKNFGLNIKDYVKVNFETLPQIIDLLGGVEIDVQQEEISYINRGVMYSDRSLEKSIVSSGVQVLDGAQALSYCRIRSIGNGDFERTERQRNVLSQLFLKMLNINPLSIPKIANEIFPLLETNLSIHEMLGLGKNVLTSNIRTLEEERFPQDGYYKGIRKNGIYYLDYDREATKEQIYQYIFEDKKL
ncbi:MAG: LCP family protein [Epulopiscium sp.]|nr:LCP family protein [Candidatus Epulonipiscium sp.]